MAMSSQYKDKVPFNYKGFSPGFVPSIGYKFTDGIYGELDLLGNSALMFTVVVPLPQLVRGALTAGAPSPQAGR